MYVLSVHVHNTGVKGAAHLMLDASNWPKFKGYVDHVHPLLDPEDKRTHLLLLPGGKIAGQCSPPSEAPRSTFVSHLLQQLKLEK